MHYLTVALYAPTPARMCGALLQASKKLRCWGQGPGGPATFHDMIARDKEVVKSVLLLTGSVEGIKHQAGGAAESVSGHVCHGAFGGNAGVCAPVPQRGDVHGKGGGSWLQAGHLGSRNA
jgi:hypothetical protein